MKNFIALRTLEVDPALLNLYPGVLLEAHSAEQVVAVPQAGELVRSILIQAEGTFSERTPTPCTITTHFTIAGATQGSSTCGPLHTGAGTVGVPVIGHPAPITVSVQTRGFSQPSGSGEGAVSFSVLLHTSSPTSLLLLPVHLWGPGEGRGQEWVGVKQSSQ